MGRRNLLKSTRIERTFPILMVFLIPAAIQNYFPIKLIFLQLSTIFIYSGIAIQNAIRDAVVPSFSARDSRNWPVVMTTVHAQMKVS